MPAEPPPAPAPVAPAEPAEPAPAEPAPAPAPAPAETPPHSANLSFPGAPPHTQVLGPDGELLGTTPGPIAVPFARKKVRLMLKAPGHRTWVQEVLPDKDASIPVRLERASETKKKRPDKNDLEEAF
jgi:hypothetical protein